MVQASGAPEEEEGKAEPEVEAEEKSRPGLTCVFETESGDQTFTFTKKPVGFKFINKIPLVVTGVEDGTGAKEAGVMKGMTLKEINGVDISGCKTYVEAAAVLK